MGVPTRLLKDADGNEILGKVTDSPASNSIGARLKSLLTGVVLAAGANAIGKVGHDKTGIQDGRKIVSDAGIREHLVSTSTPAKLLIGTAIYANEGVIAIGGATVLAARATRRGLPFYASESFALEVDDVYDVYIDSTEDNEGITFVYVT